MRVSKEAISVLEYADLTGQPIAGRTEGMADYRGLGLRQYAPVQGTYKQKAPHLNGAR
jgi:hypothetical protein